ncbi:putative transcription factor C2H2 family [Lupinus albus]|uniref:RING-type E3 ubiquitin transferase n=1 Tax=Lupinus albus TaxID=3870 RepID=A0A6A4Q2B3_LUPAL|nr:putative transcription factor C2H2 family [Lupinus albus]
MVPLPRCCVCLGEFELKEELLQIPHCKHVFHIECIHNWLQSNTTCPLCRCSIIPTTTTNKFLSTTPSIVSSQQGGVISVSSSHIILLPPQLEDEASVSSNNTHNLGE